MTDHDTIERLLGGRFPWAVVPLREGSCSVARMLAAAVSPRKVWPVCRKLHADKADPHAFRALFAAVWVLDHNLIRQNLDRGTLADMLRFGQFAQPSGDVLTVWRGGHGMTPEETTEGWSWSLSYRWAAWFACARKPKEEGGTPLVVLAEIPAACCWLMPGDLAELAGEVLLPEPPCEVQTVGSVEEWEREAFKAEAAKRVHSPLSAISAFGEVLASITGRAASDKEGCP